VILALTSSVVLLAFLIWREGFGVREANANLEFDDQPLYPNANSQSQPLIEMMAAARKVALITDRCILVST
jgi:hypothetical protein